MYQEAVLEEDRNIKLHKNCQRYVYNQNKKRKIVSSKLPEDNTKHKMLRSSLEIFGWKTNCVFCGEECHNNTIHPDGNNCHEVTTLQFKDHVLLACQKRDDKKSKEVSLRVQRFSSCRGTIPFIL